MQRVVEDVTDEKERGEAEGVIMDARWALMLRDRMKV